MACKLYANIGVGHENDWNVLESRIISAAQCNADAVVINKSTPILVIPEEKRYVSIPSKWGNLAYIEVAKRSELTSDNARSVSSMCKQIGIPLIWSVTDSPSAEFVKEHCDAQTIKLHVDSVDVYELSRYCAANFPHVIYHTSHQEDADILHKKKFKQYSIYHTTKKFPPEIEDLQLSILDKFVHLGYQVGYEGREAGIFPAMATAYKGISYIEKYLGDADSDNPSILTPAQFYDLWNSLNIMLDANQ